MAEVNARDSKLIQWLNEAYGKEKQLETALTAHIQIAEPATYKKRLQQHLKETKSHARELQRRIKKLGGKAEAVDLPGPDVVSDGAGAVASVAGRVVAGAQGAVQAVRGTSDAEKRLLARAYFGGFTAREIAEADGTPLGTVKTRLRTALIKVRRANQDKERP